MEENIINEEIEEVAEPTPEAAPAEEVPAEVEVIGIRFKTGGKISTEYAVIYITATCMDDKVRLTFRDDGFGLESALCERVFDKGWRGSDQNAGNGMGLYMVRNTVEACGGTVTASGDLGKGMSVQIALPVRRAVVRRPEEKMTAQP